MRSRTFFVVLTWWTLLPAGAAAQATPRPEATSADTLALRAPAPAWLAPAPGPALDAPDHSVPLDLAVAEFFRRPGLHESPSVRHGAAVVRFAALPGSVLAAGALYGVGHLADRSDLRDLGLHSGQALVVAGASTLAVKMIAGRTRPHLTPSDPHDFELGRGVLGDRFQSFPSAHTAAAFAAAASLARDLSRSHPEARVWINPLFYGSATVAGISRIFHEEHWATDVLGGAVIGTVAGRAMGR